MNELTFRDGDLVLCGGYTTGALLEAISDADADFSVVVGGPTFDREYAGVSIRAFAEANPHTDIRLLLPQGRAVELLETDHVSYVPTRAPDQAAIVKSWMASASRTIGVFEASEPQDGTITPGACSFLVSTILNAADVVVAEVNPQAPRLPGLEFDTSAVDYQLHDSVALPTVEPTTRSETAEAIGAHVGKLVPEGATIEIGIGTIPDAVARALREHGNLGLHGGFVGPAARDLVERGVVQDGSVVADPVDGSPFDRPILANTLLGEDRAFYDWAEDSRTVALGTVYETTHTGLVRENPRFTAINGALQVDLLGQVNAERLGNRQVSVTGGQPAYLRAGRESEGGAGIVALSSTVENGPSKIVPSITEEGVVTTARVDPDYVVTEYGIAELTGATVKRRAQQLLEVAHPDHRPTLGNAASNRGLLR